MCGIAGIANLEGLTEAEQVALPEMVRSLRHRGPDANGFFTDPRVGLGHARLSIIDLSTGQQPMSNEDGSIWIVFNGEIYNFPELRDRLTARGHRFRSLCDTEAIVHLYEEEGEDCVHSLRGMFAFAIWDQPRRRLFLARDRLGIKPLYYSRRGDRVVFGSEIKAILEVRDVPRELEVRALADYLTFMWIPAPRTIFRDVCKLPAGHVATLDERGFRVREYWDLSFPEPAETNPALLTERFLAELEESVGVHLLADVPLGAFLSGGIDSSSVVAMMARLMEEPVITNSIGFEEDGYNELRYADVVAERFHTRHHRHIVRPDAVDVVERLAWHYDEPFADNSAVPTYYVSKMARQNVTVALSGDGGDENMAGYRRYQLSQFERLVRRAIPGTIRRPVFGLASRLYPKADWLPRFLRAKSTLRNLASEDLEAIYRSQSILAPEFCRGLLQPAVVDALDGYDSLEVFDHFYRKTDAKDPLSRELYVDIKTYLVDDILTKVDRASMAVSLEVRVPVLDHKLVEFMATIPPHLKLRRGRGKYLFKRAMRPILGPGIVDRRKMGFVVPLRSWLMGPLREMVEDTIFSSSAKVRSWLDMRKVRWAWDQHRIGLRNMDNLLWAVLMLEHWARNFSGGPPAPTNGSTRKATARTARTAD